MDWVLIAKLKIFKDRLMAWGVIVNFIMLASLSLGIKFEFIHLIFLGIGALVLTIIDMKYVLPREQEYYFKRNPEWQRRKE